MSSGNIPVISIKARCLPEAWEKAVIGVWDQGLVIRTQYDRDDSLPSRDATVIVEVLDPFAEPRIHKNFPGGPAELEVYRREVVDGIHDHWIDPSAGKWTYTYHERLFGYCPVEDIRSTDCERPFKAVDQVQAMIDCLCRASYSRRAQAITWMPTADAGTDDPPCLQRVWCRLVADDSGAFKLNMNTHWRSRDLYRAWYMNAYAFTDLQKIIAGRIEERIGQPVSVGRYVDISDSLHIYGDSAADAEREVQKMKTGSFVERSWETSHPAFEMMTAEAAENLDKDPDFYASAKS